MKISYLTWLHERIGTDSETIQLPDSVNTIDDLITHLIGCGDQYADTFKNRHVIYAAINDEMASPDTTISDQDNVAFFSAIAGG